MYMLRAVELLPSFFSSTGLGTFERLPATYLLLGLDFMVTSDYHVWFIEANNTPLWPKDVSDSYPMGVSKNLSWEISTLTITIMLFSYFSVPVNYCTISMLFLFST